jgi:hypothetical protein
VIIPFRHEKLVAVALWLWHAAVAMTLLVLAMIVAAWLVGFLEGLADRPLVDIDPLMWGVPAGWAAQQYADRRSKA